jgi:membrane glycosyltransferase
MLRGNTMTEHGNKATMTDQTQDPVAFVTPQPADVALTPGGIQASKTLTVRRLVALGLCGVTLIVVLAGVAKVFAPDGITALEYALLGCIALSAPWTILGFWNSLLGLFLARGGGETLPFSEASDGNAPIRSRVAVAMAVRNEDPQRAMDRLIATRNSLDRTGQGYRFDLHIISDTNDPDVAAEEERLFALNRDMLDGMGVAGYRRRTSNEGYKAGNVWQFLHEQGDRYDLFVPLDADSLMSGGAILDLVRIAEANPRIGIVQSLAVGAPADSAFGRIFQFGMRHGMRAFTLGSAWWQGDCGPFWGHNAVIRVAAFKAHCALPKLGGRPPLGGDILSHDQVEATLMRRGGYEVRVVPVESESFEENPVTILDFMTREQRWCNGNMQYWRLLGMEGLTPTSRFQLFQAIMMYLSAPAWMILTALGVVKAIVDPMMDFNAPLALGLFVAMVGMSLTPKIVGAIHVMLQSGGVARYGGARRFGVGLAVELVFSVLMSPVVALHLTVFLIGLAFGRKVGWNGQVRDAYGLNWSTAIRALWPQTVFGAAILLALTIYTPGAVIWALPVLIGLLLAVPFAVLTASPTLGRWLSSWRLCAIPEEFETPSILADLGAPIRGRDLAA